MPVMKYWTFLLDFLEILSDVVGTMALKEGYNSLEEQEFYEQQLKEKREENNPKKIVYSDQAKMIMELFNGKYMD